MNKLFYMKKIITILLICLLWAHYVNAQYPKKDTILYNQFRDYVEWSKQQHKKTLEDFENEKYQMIYFDKAIIDRKNHKVYLYSSYDLYWAEELGAGISITIPHKIKMATKRKPIRYQEQWFEKPLNYDWTKDKNKVKKW